MSRLMTRAEIEPMDRRDALKKIAIGGATVVGASAVMSSPAFAYAAPTNIPTPTSNVTVVNASLALVIISYGGTATCPASATAGPNEIQISTAVTSGLAGTDPFLRVPGVGRLDLTTTLVSFQVRKRAANVPPPPSFINVPYVSGDSFSLDMTSTWRCTYSDGTTSDATGNGSRTWTFNGASWS